VHKSSHFTDFRVSTDCKTPILMLLDTALMLLDTALMLLDTALMLMLLLNIVLLCRLHSRMNVASVDLESNAKLEKRFHVTHCPTFILSV